MHSTPPSKSKSIFFALLQGVGTLTVIGPPGLQGLLDSMAVFTNKKYPELDVVEVGNPCVGRDHHAVLTVDLEYMKIVLNPVFVAKVPLIFLLIFINHFLPVIID